MNGVKLELFAKMNVSRGNGLSKLLQSMSIV